MNRNSINEVEYLSYILAKETNADEVRNFITEMLTDSELETLSKRWQILKMLSEGYSQRQIARELKVSLCKVTRGSQILKNKNSAVAKYLRKGKNNENK